MIHIRDGRREDLKSVVGLWEELVDHHRRLSKYYTPALDSRRRWSKYLVQKLSEKSTKLVVAADEDGELVGFMLCLLQPNPPIFKERTVGLISDVYIRPERRRKGIMKEMLRVALAWFKKNRCKSVALTVAAQNLEARAVWNQLGFKPHMIHKRLDMDSRYADDLLENDTGRSRKKVVRKRREG